MNDTLPIHDPRRPRATSGYLLIEAAVALVLLAVGTYAVHGALRQCIITRALAQDETHARFLLEQVLGEVQFVPVLEEGAKAGQFRAPHDRFRWRYTVQRIDVPLPKIPAKAAERGIDIEDLEERLEDFYLVHVHATVTWARSNQEYTAEMETLLDPKKLADSERKEGGRRS